MCGFCYIEVLFGKPDSCLEQLAAEVELGRNGVLVSDTGKIRVWVFHLNISLVKFGFFALSFSNGALIFRNKLCSSEYGGAFRITQL